MAAGGRVQAKATGVPSGQPRKVGAAVARVQRDNGPGLNQIIEDLGNGARVSDGAAIERLRIVLWQER